MKFIPMLYSTPMVQAIQEKRKTKTRRTKGLENLNPFNIRFIEMDYSSTDAYARFEDLLEPEQDDDRYITIKCPYGKPGDVIWVRESFCQPISEQLNSKYFYKADLEKQKWDFKWVPSIHMPKAAARHFLKIKSITVESLQNITEADAVAEGVELHESGRHWLNYYDAHHKVTQFIYNCDTAARSFQSLWWLINGKRDEPNAWFKNPFVWVIEFERIQKPINFC